MIAYRTSEPKINSGEGEIVAGLEIDRLKATLAQV